MIGLAKIIEAGATFALHLLLNYIFAIKVNTMKKYVIILAFISIYPMISAKEYHVSKNGSDTNPGTHELPFLSINEAAQHAYPGDTITVHEGTYREQINPVRGGDSDSKRILYRAAPGEKVQIKGSEVLPGWQHVKGTVWKVIIPDSFFGDYHPFRDSVHGDWFHSLGRIHHTGDVFLNGKSLYEVETINKVYKPEIEPGIKDAEGRKYTWYCENKGDQTTIWANFQEYDPNSELVEASARRTCFFPEEPGMNYITIQGFHFSQAATQWAAPTAEQAGMIATHWNKGWIIENNVISDSKCSGITLGKDRSTGHNVWSNDVGNINRDGNIHYVEVIFRVLRNNWDKEHIGSHIVRNNTIYNCEQAGICGSMGAVFSTIENNHIYNINIKEQFKGWEIAGIKIHAPVDVMISYNCVHDCERGIWLDWMTQGARVTRNLLYRNKAQDLFIEVNHGPYIVDNNILLSDVSLSNWSQGGAYVHNLFMGKIEAKTVSDRFTPYFLPHSTDIAGLTTIFGGDDRFYNNVFAWSNDEGLIAHYDSTKYLSYIRGNVYLNGVSPPKLDESKVVIRDERFGVEIIESNGKVKLTFSNRINPTIQNTDYIDSQLLGITKISKSAFVNPNGNDILFDRDYLNNQRSKEQNCAGPFADTDVWKDGKTLVVWH